MQLFIGKNSHWFIQLFRYTLVGGLSFVIDYGLLYILTSYWGIYYILSATISFIAGLVINYLISTRWVFNESKLKNRTAEFIIYGLIGVVGLVINNALLYLFTDYLHIYYMVSKLITATIVMIWNFVGRKVILFKN